MDNNTIKKIYTIDELNNIVINIANKYNIDINNINKNIPQWYFILNQIGEVFKTNNYFKLDNNYNYDVNLIINYIQPFIDICNIFNIIPSKNMFYKFIGINNKTVVEMLRVEKLTHEQMCQAKLLDKVNIELQLDKFSNSNDIKSMAYFNNVVLPSLNQQTQTQGARLDNMPILSISEPETTQADPQTDEIIQDN